MEDMQGYYTRKIFNVDPFEARYRDAERALDLARATVVVVFENVLSEWRRGSSVCSGATVLALRDIRPGAGWGIVDSLARPKASWYAAKRVFSPLALLLTNEGLNGLHLHLVNDSADPVSGSVRVELFIRGELMVESVERRAEVQGRSTELIQVVELFDGFRDLTDAYSFGPPAYDVVSCTFVDEEGLARCGVIHQPAGLSRAIEPDIGLNAQIAKVDEGWELTVSTRRFAQWVVVEVPGFRPDDSWFHLAPGNSKSIALYPEPDSTASPAGEVRSLNSLKSARFSG
jgi:beta-mannosidase